MASTQCVRLPFAAGISATPADLNKRVDESGVTGANPNEMPPLLMTTLRFLLIALILVPFTRIKRKQLPLIAKLAVSFGLMHFSLFFWI